MKPDMILKSDVIDILFEHRNKEYGAYTLRKNYNARLWQAMGGTSLLVLLFVGLQSMKPAAGNEPLTDLPDFTVIEIPLQPVDPEKPEPAKPQPQQKAVSTINATAPDIVPDNKVKNEVATQSVMDESTLSTTTNEVPNGGTGDPVQPDTGGGNSDPVVATDPAPEEPLERADVMPSFNGDFARFMLRNLRQPDDIGANERYVVRVRFVVTAEGDINDVEVVQSGRPDLDREVVRVVQKMPRWKPGMQGGRPVPVYFHLPVTFISSEE